MLRINQLKLPVTHTQEQLEKKLIKTLKINRNDMKQYRIRKRSLDARKKPELCYVYSIDLEVKHEERILKQLKGRDVKVSEESYRVPEHGSEELHDRPVIVGTDRQGCSARIFLPEKAIAPSLLRGELRSESGRRT